MKAAIYARYSSENQRESSIEDQVSECRKEADRLGYPVGQVFTDAALSGQLNEDQRPGFQAMQTAAQAREFDVLLVDDASRLSRDQSDALRVLKRFEFWGVGLIARTDGVNTIQNPKSSRLLFGVKSAFSEEFLRDLAEKTHRGLGGRVRAGFSPGGLPYGYRSGPAYDGQQQIIGFRKVIYAPEAEIVRRIFTLYADGASARRIAILLNEEGIAPPGARWKKKTIRHATTWSYTAIIGHRRLKKGILNNPLYIGRQVWNRSQWMRDPDTKAHHYRVRPASEHVEADLPDLRIIDPDLWDRVQVRLVLNDVPRANGRRNIGKYLLSGLLRCGECGGAYTKENHSYRCGNHRNRGNVACTNIRTVTVARLERLVLTALRERLYTPEHLGTLIAHVRDNLLARAKREGANLPSGVSSARLAALDREITNIKTAVLKGKATETLLQMLEEKTAERAALVGPQAAPPSSQDVSARLAKVLAELPERVQAYLSDLETLLAQDQVERGKDILAALGTEVIVYPDKVSIKGDLGKALTAVSGRDRGNVVSWLGEEDSNPH